MEIDETLFARVTQARRKINDNSRNIINWAHAFH